MLILKILILVYVLTFLFFKNLEDKKIKEFGLGIFFYNDSPKHYVSRSDLLNDLVWLKEKNDLVEISVDNFIPFQKPATPAMEGIIDLHHDIFFFLIIILTIVAVILFSTLDMHYMESYRFMKRHYFLFHYTTRALRPYQNNYAFLLWTSQYRSLDFVKELLHLFKNYIYFWLFTGHIKNYRNFVWIAYIRNFDGVEATNKYWEAVNPEVFGPELKRVIYGTIKRSSNIGTNFLLEIIWTVIPAFILLIIVIPSFALLYGMDELIKAYLTVKVIGHQWYWSYEIADRTTFSNKYLTYNRYLINFFFLEKLSEKNKIKKSFLFFNNNYFEKIVSNEKVQIFKNNLLIKENLIPIIFFLKDKEEPKFFFLEEKTFVLNNFSFLPSFSLFLIEQKILFPNFFSIFDNNWKNLLEILNKMTIKVIKFDSYMLPLEDLKYGQHRMYLSVTKALVVPIKMTIRILVTSMDVLHSWAIPSLGIKLDAAPGRLNQTCLYLKRHGSFYGQCSEICGVNHAFMPIHVKGVRFHVFLRFLQNYYIELYYPYKKNYFFFHSFFDFSIK